MPEARSAVPRRVGLLAAVVLHGVLVAGALAVRDGLGDHDRWDWGRFLERGTVFAVVMGITIGIQQPLQRLAGSGTAKQKARREADRAVSRAVWHGVLPSDVDPVQWRQQVVQWLRPVRAGRIAYSVLVVVVGVLVAVTAFEVDDGDRGVLALAAVLVLAGPALLVATRGPVRRARQLRDGQLPVA